MELIEEHVGKHYGRGQLLNTILEALRETGKDPNNIIPADLAPVDEFHIRGREATVEVARFADLKPGIRVLDVGCGLGGSARFLASEYQCRATGIDLTQEYVDAANTLSDLVGLSHIVDFKQGNALSLPFDDGSFDVVWTEHAQMNIADKQKFYGEIARVLNPGGELLFHDIFRGEGDALYFPVPWAEDESINFLITPKEVKNILEETGFIIREWEDKSQASLDWFIATKEKLQQFGPPLLGFHLLIGDNAVEKFDNQIKNLRDNRFVVIQAIATI